jgi:hypothetical protein
VETLQKEQARRIKRIKIDTMKSTPIGRAFIAGWEAGYSNCADDAWPDVGMSLPVTMEEAFQEYYNKRQTWEK